MSYYPVDADTDKEVSLVFLPARAAAVATALSGVASFIALVFTAEVAYCVDSLGSSESALLEVTAVFWGVVVATGIALIYVRVQPPTASNLWAVVPQVISYVMVLCLATIGFATASIFVALVPLARCDGETCEHQNRAIRTICALAIAIVAVASLGILVTYDLHSTRPEVEAVVYRAQVRETMLYARWRRDQSDGEALWVAQSAWTSPSFRDSHDLQAGEMSGYGALSRESGRVAGGPTAPGLFSSPPSGTAAAPGFWPRSLVSVGKHAHHHQHHPHRHEESSTTDPEDSEESPDSNTTGAETSETDDPPHHKHKRTHEDKHKHKHPHHHHHPKDGTPSDSDERRRRRNKDTVDSKVMSQQYAANSGPDDSMPAETVS